MTSWVGTLFCGVGNRPKKIRSISIILKPFLLVRAQPLGNHRKKKLGIQQIWENIFSYGGILNAFDAGKEGVNIFRKNVHVRLHIFIFENNHVKQKMKIVCGAHVALLLLRKWMPAVPGHPSMPGHRSNIEMLVITNQTANVGISFQFLNITWKRVMAGIP